MSLIFFPSQVASNHLYFIHYLLKLVESESIPINKQEEEISMNLIFLLSHPLILTTDKTQFREKKAWKIVCYCGFNFLIVA